MKASKEFFIRIFNEMIPFHQTLGLTLEDADEGYAKVKIPFQTGLIGDPRIQAIHGGVIASAMDAAGGIAGSTTLTSMEDKISTIDFRVDFLRSARACDLWVEGKVTRSGNRIISTQMKAFKEDGTLVAEGRGVYNVSRKGDNKISDTD
jgi:uncharacterized protein (TIGR00369 family)